MPLLLEKFLAFVRRDLLIASRYRGTLVTFPLTLVTELAGAYFLARARKYAPANSVTSVMGKVTSVPR